jgi:hypothetical protein
MERESDAGRQIVHRFTSESTDSLRTPSRVRQVFRNGQDADEQRRIQEMYEEIERRVAEGRALLDSEHSLSKPINYNQAAQDELILNEQKQDTRSQQLTTTRTHKSLQQQLDRELSRETENVDGLRTSIKQHVVQRVTTYTPLLKVSSIVLRCLSLFFVD